MQDLLDKDVSDETVEYFYKLPLYARRRWLVDGSTNIPRFFYKYRHVPQTLASTTSNDWTGLERLLTQNEIYYAAVDQFNDVHESVANVILNSDKSTILEAMIAIAMRVKGVSSIEAEAFIQTEFLADRQRLSMHLESVINRGLRKAGIFSMTQDAREPTMWGYYASESAGIAVQLASQHAVQPLALAEEVTYVEQKPALDYMLESLYDRMGDRMLELLTTKHDRWAHESEWRLLHRGAHDVETLPPEAVSGLIFGPRATPYSIAFVQELLAARVSRSLPMPKLWRAVVNPARRRLTIRRFTE